MQPGEHAAAILAHYLKHLTLASGRRWTAANDADMDTLADLLDQGDAEGGDAIPPFARPIVSDRVTQEFSRRDEWEEQQMHDFERWRQEKAQAERYEQTRRLVRRGGEER
jgi:hypothetical protein